MESVVDRSRNPDMLQNAHSRAVMSNTRSRIKELKKKIDEKVEETERLKEHSKYLDEINKTRKKGWWEEIPIESMNREQVREQIEWFQIFKAQVERRIEELRNGGSSSALNQQASTSAESGDIQSPNFYPPASLDPSNNGEIVPFSFPPSPPNPSASDDEEQHPK